MGNKNKKHKKHRGWQESKSSLFGGFDKIKNNAIKGWDSASNFYQSNINPLVDKVQEGANKVSELASNDAITGAISGIAGAIDPEGGAEAVQKIAGVAKGAGEAVSDIKGLGHDIGSAITGGVEGARGKSGIDAAKAIVSGAKQAKGASADALSEFSRKYKGGALGVTRYGGGEGGGAIGGGLSRGTSTIAASAGPSHAESTMNVGTERHGVGTRAAVHSSQAEVKPGNLETKNI